MSVLVAVLVLPLTAIGALRIVANDWIVHFEVDHGRLPDDRYGFTGEDRRRLALLGLDSILPGGAGIDLLRAERFSDGSPTFGPRELRHMEDVRQIVGIAFPVHTAVAGLLGALVLASWRLRAAARAVARGLRWGAYLTVGTALVLGIFMAVAWNTFFDGFHHLFFQGRTWWFPTEDTLRRVFPDEFWMGVAGWIAGIASVLTGVVWVGATLWLRRLAGQERRPSAPNGVRPDDSA